MNRKKRINSILKSKQKKMNAKLHKSNKPRYISKAERTKMEAEENAQNGAEVTSEAATAGQAQAEESKSE